MVLEYINKENNYSTIKEVARAHFHISNRLIQKLKNNNCIFLNDIPANINESINSYSKIKFDLNYSENNDNIVPINEPLEILYEDEGFLIINKPPFIPTHPSLNHYEDSLSNRVAYYFQTNNIHKKIRPVNRLDKNTSGIVIFAKNEYIQEQLIKQMSTDQFHKKYIGIVNGFILPNIGIIDAPISRKSNSIIEREINFINGQKAITKYKSLKTFKDYSLIEFELLTGRTHQIRVHTAFINHPLLGDNLYGRESSLISRHALHAYSIKFIHPISLKEINVTAQIPFDIQKLI